MHNNTTTITPIDEAVADLKLQESGEQYTLKEISEKHSIDHSMLGRQWRYVIASKEEGYSKQQALYPQQELELVRYVEQLTKRGLPPIREMIQILSSSVVKSEPSKSWVTCFINRYNIHLISK
jgi:hypothetical protein